MDGISSFSRPMYCQMSSSVQLDRGNTLMCSPLCIRVLKMFHSSGRWLFGSHWPNSSRKEKTRSLALAFSSSRRPPPEYRVELMLLDGIEQGRGLQPVTARPPAGLLPPPAPPHGAPARGRHQAEPR